MFFHFLPTLVGLSSVVGVADIFLALVMDRFKGATLCDTEVDDAAAVFGVRLAIVPFNDR